MSKKERLIKVTSKVRDKGDEIGCLIKAFIRDGGTFEPIHIRQHVRYVRPGLAGAMRGKV